MSTGTACAGKSFVQRGTTRAALMVAAITSFVLIGAASAPAAIIGTYVDAKPSGTAAAWASPNTSPSGAFAFSYTGDSGDGFWDDRTGFGLDSNGTLSGTRNILEAGTSNVETLPTITTTVSGLALQRYDVYVLYWSTPTTADWSVRAKLSTAASFVEYDRSGTLGTAGTDTSINGAGLNLYEAYIGTTATVTSFSVNLLNSTSTDFVNNRTWYDGVAYVELPEPASLGLMGVGGMLLLRRRRA